MNYANELKAFPMGIDTHQELVVYMRDDCHLCRSEGFVASNRLNVSCGGRSIIAVLNVVYGGHIPHGHIGLSNSALERLWVRPGTPLTIKHAPPIRSLAAVRKKVFGHTLSDHDITAIIDDVTRHRYSDIEIAAFLSVCACGRLSLAEITDLTRAMVASGERLAWGDDRAIYDKHCIGGLPGNRTTPLVVAICSAGGLVMPKTSSRAITSPAGTADTMDALTHVDLGVADIRRVVEEAGACLAWGGSMNLSPADDLLIRIERALELDGEGQLIASVLSKKIAAGSTHVLIDIPVGPTAKVRSQPEAERLESLLVEVGAACGLSVRCVVTDGRGPVGRGIGPVEEARDVLAVLQQTPEAPADLRDRALELASHLFDMASGQGLAAGREQARALLEDGHAWAQFRRIVTAQGGLKTLPQAVYTHEEKAARRGVLNAIDNRRLAKLAKLAGAPASKAAGLRLSVALGDRVEAGQPLFQLFSESAGERDYALDYYASEQPIFSLVNQP
ncbi:thymidine phosphorylase family protein [Marinobacter sp. R17]|uniref:thymidine phosphorylase family protein n=1 Tax=Marinobacter sp. R17 TaxID=2484250 RepID=UPI001CC2118B|nr:thymidine phosphorylase family protein [Marinobacter sp. R17]